MKAHEYKLKPRPYSDDEAKTLLAKVIDADTSVWHYSAHHKGYVEKLNEIEKALETADVARANGNYSQFGELKRRWTWNHAGSVLHDLYWENLGGDGDAEKAPDVLTLIKRDFGTLEDWKADFKGCSLAAKLSGWGVLIVDQLGSGELRNVLVDEHHYGAVWGAVPLIACDVFEHAYYHKDGPKRGVYIENFIADIHWGRVNDRYKKYAAR
jgi:Fe-Mn family superoxide dismutase